MPDRMRAIEADFEELVQRLTALMDVYAEDLGFEAHAKGLRHARDLATQAVDLIRTSREAKS